MEWYKQEKLITELSVEFFRDAPIDNEHIKTLFKYINEIADESSPSFDDFCADVIVDWWWNPNKQTTNLLSYLHDQDHLYDSERSILRAIASPLEGLQIPDSISSKYPMYFNYI